MTAPIREALQTFLIPQRAIPEELKQARKAATKAMSVARKYLTPGDLTQQRLGVQQVAWNYFCEGHPEQGFAALDILPLEKNTRYFAYLQVYAWGKPNWASTTKKTFTTTLGRLDPCEEKC